ncbi:trifunctional histidinol dehydrogenase, partial [Ascosphaera atra]
MSVPFLIEADPGVFQSGDSATTTTTSKLTLKQISYFGRVLAKFESVAQAVDAVKASRSLLDVYVDARAIESAGDVVDVLNAGAVKALVDVTQASALLTEQQVPANRLLVFISSKEELEAAKTLLTQDHSKYNGVSVVFSPDTEPDSKSLGLSETSEVFRTFSSTYSWNKSEIEEKRLLPILPASSLDLSSDKGFPIDLLTAGVVPDQSNGLMATVVTDERSVSLGLVWSSQESLYKALQTGTGVYQSRKRGLWYKGQSSGDVQELVSVGFDCDSDCLVFVVRQKGRGFCHLGTASCFGEYRGLSALQKTLQGRKESAPAGSYTARLFNDEKLLQSKIMEEADELCQAKTKDEIAFEAADLFYFALTRCVAAGVSLEDVERNLDFKSLKLKRRTGDAKPQWAEKVGYKPEQAKREQPQEEKEAPAPKRQRTEESSRIEMPRIVTANASVKEVDDALQRPSQKSNDAIVAIVRPIIDDVRTNGDAAVLKYTHRFEKATSLTSPVLKAPFPADLMQLDEETTKAIDVSYENIRTFHAAQQEDKPLR